MAENSRAVEICGDIRDLLFGIRRTFFPSALELYNKDINEQPHNEVDKIRAIEKLSLLKLTNIRYRERKDIKYAMTSFFSALHGSNCPLVYILLCKNGSASIYLGFWDNETQDFSLQNDQIKAAIKGFTPGCEFASLDNGESKKITSTLNEFKSINSIMGVPSEKQIFSDEKRSAPMEYGIERLADAMTGDSFALVIRANPVNIEDASHYFSRISEIRDYVHGLVKVSEQYSHGTQSGRGAQASKNNGGNESSGSNEGWSETPNLIKRFATQIKNFFIGGDSYAKQCGKQFTTGTSWGKSESISYNEGESDTNSKTLEIVNNQALFAEEILNMLQNRIKTGIGEGLWQTSILLLSDKGTDAEKAANIVQGMWGGAQSYQDPLRSIEISPLLKGNNKIEEAFIRMNKAIVDDHPLGTAYQGGYTWITSGELSIEANLPHYELPELSSEALIEYGRFLPKFEEEKKIKLGALIDRGIKTDSPVYFDTERLNRHLFVTGLTGSGKSNTIRSILLELAKKNIPFLVIEPVKAEYRALNEELKKLYKKEKTIFTHVNVFSPSGINAEKLTLNPFSFDIHDTNSDENAGIDLIAHIDRLKAVFNAALGMYSSMPFILEEMIYRAYKNAGWDIETGKNKYFEVARSLLGVKEDSELRSFFLPLLSDLAAQVDPAIEDFFKEKSDYNISLTGALKSRLKSLTLGAKGSLLNQRMSFPISELLKTPCVIELGDFTDNDEKAFVMALLLSRIYEYRITHNKPGKQELQHVMVIEEAHRLLSNPLQSGEHTANGRGKSIEVFADMLAEIRSYGQGIIIADQIPAKLIPDVLKNTDIKIAHRLIAKDDREAIGSAMNLNDKQIGDLNRATPGLATVSFYGLNNPIRVKIEEVKTEPVSLNDASLTQKEHDAIAEYQFDLFPGPSLGNSKFLQLMEEKRKNSELLVLRLFVIAAVCCNKDFLSTFRQKTIESNYKNNHTPLYSEEELWSAVVEGSFTVLSDLWNEGYDPGCAGIVISSFIMFARKWSCNDGFDKELKELKQVVFTDQNSPGVISKIGPYDALTSILQIYLDAKNQKEGIKG
ncbi:hypothetical protein FACS1894163_09640 [Spirochaetia bacterium]|nr:hypothetical protein FACS1894163_09640 [Spirochaetia bacterium]